VLLIGFVAINLTAAEQSQSWKVDPVHSSVVFKIRHFQHSDLYGRFNHISGNLTTGSNPSFELTIPATSIDTNNTERDNHLRSPDFFNVKQFPAITLKSSEVTVEDDTYHLTADLTLHGVTKSITVELTKIGEGKDPMGNTRIGFNTTFTIKRSDFAMTNMLENVGDEVTLMIGFEALPQ